MGRKLYSPLRLRIAALRLTNNETRCGALLNGFGLRIAWGCGGGGAGTMPAALWGAEIGLTAPYTLRPGDPVRWRIAGEWKSDGDTMRGWKRELGGEIVRVIAVSAVMR